MFSTNFGSLCWKVTNFGSQNFGYQIWFCTWLQQTAYWNWIQIVDFSVRVTLEFDGWPRKTILVVGVTSCGSQTKGRHIYLGWQQQIEQRLPPQTNMALRWLPVCPTGRIGHFYTTSSLCIMSNPSVNSKWSYSQETLNSGWNWRYFVPCDPQIWWMTLENNRAPLLYYVKLCASFQIHRWSETWVTGRKRSIRVKIDDFFSRINLEMWWMTLKKQ